MLLALQTSKCLCEFTSWGPHGKLNNWVWQSFNPQNNCCDNIRRPVLIIRWWKEGGIQVRLARKWRFMAKLAIRQIGQTRNEKSLQTFKYASKCLRLYVDTQRCLPSLSSLQRQSFRHYHDMTICSSAKLSFLNPCSRAEWCCVVPITHSWIVHNHPLLMANTAS